VFCIDLLAFNQGVEKRDAMAEPKKRILVVDDSEEIQQFFQLVLEAAGYDVKTASSGEEGLKKAKVSRPDLIVLDLIMPGMDGLEVLTCLRSDLAPPLPPVILCSGFDFTEEEALRRGALMFIRKPVAPEDLRDFVTRGLLGAQVPLETAARERANSAAARVCARQAASTFVAKIRPEAVRRTVGHLSWLAGYFGLETAIVTLMEDGRLTVFAAAGDPSYTIGLDISRKLPPCYEILESRSSLVLGDASTHACFSSGPYRLEGVRFFAGVPLLAPEGIVIGVVCVLDSHRRRTDAEDLLMLEQVGRQGSLFFRLLALGRPDLELPGRLGAGMLLRPSFELTVDAELRLLRRYGGSMELAVAEMADPQPMRKAVMNAKNRERLAAGALGPTRVAVCKRHDACDAQAELQSLISGVEAKTSLHALGSAAISGSQLPALEGHDLLRLAELALEQALQSGGGRYRLALEHEYSATPQMTTSDR
jgi:twitching motility two-component system response regulator PilH